MKPVKLFFFSALSGLLIVTIVIIATSVITDRQAVLSLGYYNLQNPPSLGDFLFLRPDGAVERRRLSNLCPEVGDVIDDVIIRREDIRGFRVSWAYSRTFSYLPWRTHIEIPIASLSNTPFTELFNAMVKADHSCEAIVAEQSRQSCLLVVTTVAITTDGNRLVSLSGCQLIGANAPDADALAGGSSFGSGLLYKDRFSGVSALERFWARLRDPFIRTSDVY